MPSVRARPKHPASAALARIRSTAGRSDVADAIDLAAGCTQCGLVSWLLSAVCAFFLLPSLTQSGWLARGRRARLQSASGLRLAWAYVEQLNPTGRGSRVRSAEPCFMCCVWSPSPRLPVVGRLQATGKCCDGRLSAARAMCVGTCAEVAQIVAATCGPSVSAPRTSICLSEHARLSLTSAVCLWPLHLPFAAHRSGIQHSQELIAGRGGDAPAMCTCLQCLTPRTKSRKCKG